MRRNLRLPHSQSRDLEFNHSRLQPQVPKLLEQYKSREKTQRYYLHGTRLVGDRESRAKGNDLREMARRQCKSL